MGSALLVAVIVDETTTPSSTASAMSLVVRARALTVAVIATVTNAMLLVLSLPMRSLPMADATLARTRRNLTVVLVATRRNLTVMPAATRRSLTAALTNNRSLPTVPHT